MAKTTLYVELSCFVFLGPHSKFQNTWVTPSGKKVKTLEEPSYIPGVRLYNGRARVFAGGVWLSTGGVRLYAKGAPSSDLEIVPGLTWNLSSLPKSFCENA